MNTVQKIAVDIYRTGQAQGWKLGTKTADTKNMEAWRGACIALQVTEHEDFHHALRVFSVLILSRGYTETRNIAVKAAGEDCAKEYQKQFG